MKKLTQNDVEDRDDQTIELPGGLSLRIECKPDEAMSEPWKEADGHGPVSGWERRNKHPGERILSEDRGRAKLFYDFRGAMKLARKDGWGLNEKELAALSSALGRAPTRGEICAEAVNRDYRNLKAWCDGDWHYVYVWVQLRDADGEEISDDACGGVEGFGDWWKEMAVENANMLLEQYEKEQAEAQHWAERDVATVKGGAS